MADVKVDLADVERARDDLETFAKRALPYAVRNSLNTSAFEGRKEWTGQIKRSFILRNTFTTRSLRVVKARGTDLNDMASFLGSVAKFMGDQERGGVLRGRFGRSKPVPTAVAAGQAPGARPRTKQVRRPNWLTTIRINRRLRTRAKSRGQLNLIKVRLAAKRGQRFALLDLGKRKGLVRITGKKRITVRMVWDLSRRAVRVPAEPTLQRTLTALEPRLPLIHRDALVDQLRRHKVLGYT